MSIPRTPITAPTARPPRYSLLAIAEPATVPEEVWGAGFVFDPEALTDPGQSGLFSTESLFGWENEEAQTVCEVPPQITPAFDGPERDQVIGYPFLVWAADKCSTFGYQARDWQGRAQRLLRSVESAQIAKKLWEGGTGLTASLYELADVTALGGSVVEAVARLEKEVAVAGAGAPAMFHMSPHMLTRGVAAQVLWRDGAVWRTPMGHVVVADAGYSGLGPTSLTNETIMASPMVSVALTPVETVPGSLQQAIDWASALDRATNTVEVRVQRQALLVWDPSYVLGMTTDVPLTPPSY